MNSLTVAIENLDPLQGLFVSLFLFPIWFDLHIAEQKQLRETLESHRLKKEDFINSIRRDKDKMETIKVHCCAETGGMAALSR